MWRVLRQGSAHFARRAFSNFSWETVRRTPKARLVAAAVGVGAGALALDADFRNNTFHFVNGGVRFTRTMITVHLMPSHWLEDSLCDRLPFVIRDYQSTFKRIKEQNLTGEEAYKERSAVCWCLDC